ncbi:MAG: SPOR domain-containing protein [Alphaproteobacteria bacterium]|nr:SPOR domain-containing protein [Alphaproteobacteria bacterium]
MNDDNSLDLLDLDDNGAMDTLPDATPFAAPRPKKPWLLLGVGLVVIVLATYVIIRAIGDDSASSIDVDLDAPVVMDAGVPADMNVLPPVQPVQAMPQPQPVQVQPMPVAKPQPMAATAGVPVRVVEERQEVKFNPVAETKTVAQPKPVAAKPVAKPVAKKTATKPVAKSATQTVSKPVAGAWYVQFGSYSTRALAESAQRQIQNAHKSLFDGQQFVILAAQLKDGKTTYRLRVAFKTASDANGFCRNAKSDGLDCYVAK